MFHRETISKLCSTCQVDSPAARTSKDHVLYHSGVDNAVERGPNRQSTGGAAMWPLVFFILSLAHFPSSSPVNILDF